MLKRNNCVYTQIIKHCSEDDLLPIIRDLSDISETKFYSDYWGAYDGLVDFFLCFAYNYKQKGQRHIIVLNTQKMSLH